MARACEITYAFLTDNFVSGWHHPLVKVGSNYFAGGRRVIGEKIFSLSHSYAVLRILIFEANLIVSAINAVRGGNILN